MNLYGKLTFNGYTFPNYEIVSVGESTPNLFAINRTMNTEDGVATSLFNNFTNKPSTLSFDLIKVDKNRNALSFTRSEIFDLQRRLFSKVEVGVLQVKNKNNLLLYGAFVGEPKESFLGGVQYMSLDFQSISPYCYSSVLINNYKINNEKIIEIYNESIARNKIIPDIEIDMWDGSDIELINLSTGEKMNIKGMEEFEKVYIYGETSEFISKVDNDRNIFNLSSKKAMSLAYGKNSIKITARKASVKFIYQYELLLY